MVGANSTTLNDSTNGVMIGAEQTGNYFNGYIDSLRITKGYARYTSNFTPPTAAFPVGRDETVDPFWNYTVLAMHMDDLTDATGRHAITASNSAATSTSTYIYGTASLALNGSNQCLTTPTSSDFKFKAADWTIEGWFYETSSSGSRTILGFGDVSSGGCPVEIRTTSTTFDFYDDTTGGASATPAYSRILNVWRHFAVSKSNGTIRIFLGGIQIGSTTASNTMPSFTSTVYIGAVANGGPLNYFAGSLDDLRITKGIARYTQNFTPPTRAFATTPVSTYTDYDPFWSNVVLLMHMDGTNGSSSFVDETGRHTFTTSTGSGSSTPTLSTAQSKLGTASLSAPGGGYVAAAGNTTDWNLSGQFTIETFFYPTSMPNDAWFLTFGYNTNGRLGIHNSKLCWNTNTYNDTSTVSTNTWQHAAITRDASNTTRIFLNGALAGTLNNDTTSYSNSTLRIGSDQQVRYVGYVDETRITQGVARYTSSFAAPRIAHPNSSGIVTSGLVCLLDAGDAASYDGSSQTWKNIVTSPADSSSQTAYDFYRGSSSSSESSDPTFIGVAGGMSANDYFTFNGSQYFTVAGGNTSFINSLSQSTAAFTLVFVYMRTTQAADLLFGTGYNTDGIAIRVGGNAGGYSSGTTIGYRWANGGDQLLYVDPSYGKPHFLAVSVNASAGAGGSFLYYDGSIVATFVPNAFGSTGGATANLGAWGNGTFPSTDLRYHWVAMYNRALTKAELDQTFNAVRSRFGI